MSDKIFNLVWVIYSIILILNGIFGFRYNPERRNEKTTVKVKWIEKKTVFEKVKIGEGTLDINVRGFCLSYACFTNMLLSGVVRNNVAKEMVNGDKLT